MQRSAIYEYVCADCFRDLCNSDGKLKEIPLTTGCRCTKEFRVRTITSGDPGLLGVTSHSGGYNFALFSQHAVRVELCLFSADGTDMVAAIDLPDCVDGVWSGFLPGLQAPFAYGYRVHGPWDPCNGHRFNPHKLLLDPYARSVVGSYRWHPSAYGDKRFADEKNQLCTMDSAPWVPKGLVQPSNSCLPRPCTTRTPWPRTLIWEAHVRATTMCHPTVPFEDRGKFRGMASPAIIQYLKAHGISTVELMPIQSTVTERHLQGRQLVNFWGYNPLGWFAFNPQYAGIDPLADFCWMVHKFHEAGIEVLIDVVYNHTCESDELGPTLCYRGIDNTVYYRLHDHDKRRYINDTGCGNTLNVEHPIVRRLVLDNLRWLASLGVDGFRFDLGVTLGRRQDGFHRDAPLWQDIINDPVLKTRRLITEPWDIGPGGYQLGHMPFPTVEWNDRYRDTLRRAWRGDAHQMPDLARRLHGSADLFESNGRLPHCSLNYLASHDGASLADLVTYVNKHNEPNGEDNRDGHHDNIAQNFGVEGPTNDPDLLLLRGRTLRSMLATLLVSQGTPMITAGDEFGHSRQGNNNAYCQDNAINWLDWREAEVDRYGLRAVISTLMALRREFPEVFVDKWRQSQSGDVCDCVEWFYPSGRLMTVSDWENPELRQLVMRVSADNRRQCLVVALNASDTSCEFVLPLSGQWRCALDTAHPVAAAPSQLQLKSDETLPASATRFLIARSVQIFIDEQIPRCGHDALNA